MKWYAELIIETDGVGYHGYCPFLPGLHVGGDTKNGTLKSLGDSISAYMDSVMKHTPDGLKWQKEEYE